MLAVFGLAAAGLAVNKTMNVTYGLGLVGCAYGQPNATCKEFELKLDIYRPAGTAAAGKRPAIVVMHGGGNSGGDRSGGATAKSAEHFASEGFVAFNIDYRLLHQDGARPHFPNSSMLGAQWIPKWSSGYPAVRDLKAAVRYVRSVAAEYGIDKSKVAVTGGSAGATNAVATGVTFDDDYKTELTLEQDPTLSSTHMEESSSVQVVYTHWSSDGEIDLIQEFDPQHRTRYTKANAPVIEFHGDKDTTIPIQHAYNVQAEYNKTGVAYEMHVLEGCGHASYCWGCGAGVCQCNHKTGSYCSKMDDIALPFIKKHLGL